MVVLQLMVFLLMALVAVVVLVQQVVMAHQ
jgi:hypothetical protein